MHRWMILFLLVATMTALSNQHDDYYRSQLELNEIIQQDLRLNRVVSELNKIRDRFASLKPLADPLQEVTLNARIRSLEGSRCERPEQVECGGRSVGKCVSDLFVCDGIVDCANGRDEDPNICNVDNVKVGNTFIGYSYWNHCRMSGIYRTMLVITNSRRDAIFASRIWMGGYVLNQFVHGEQKYDVVGHFNFGKRRIVLTPANQTGSDLAVECQFNRGDDIHLGCKLVNPGTFIVCGTLVMVKL